MQQGELLLAKTRNRQQWRLKSFLSPQRNQPNLPTPETPDDGMPGGAVAGRLRRWPTGTLASDPRKSRGEILPERTASGLAELELGCRRNAESGVAEAMADYRRFQPDKLE